MNNTIFNSDEFNLLLTCLLEIFLDHNHLAKIRDISVSEPPESALARIIGYIAQQVSLKLHFYR